MNDTAAAVAVLGAVVTVMGHEVLRLQERVKNSASGGPILQGTDLGLNAGMPWPSKELRSLAGSSIVIGGRVEPQRTAILMLSTTCQVCKVLSPVVPAIVGVHREARWVAMVAGDIPAIRSMVKLAGIPETMTVPTTIEEMRNVYGVTYYPFTYVLGRDGRVAAKALTARREHIEILMATAKERDARPERSPRPRPSRVERG